MRHPDGAGEADMRNGRGSAPGRAVALMVATVLLLGLVTVAPSSAAGAEPAETFIVGAATRSIAPSQAELTAGVYLGGYDFGPSRKGSVDPASDAISARAMVIGVGDQRVALVTLDVVGMGNIWMRAIRNGVAAATGISARGVMVHVSHSHGAPDFQGIWGGVPSSYRQRVVRQAVEAVEAAVAVQEPAELRVAATQVAELHGNRRAPATNRDDALSVMQFTRAEADPGSEVIATLVNYGAHPTVTGRADTVISTDFVGPVVEALEAAFPGSVGMFVNGTLGDLSPNAPDPSDGADQRPARQRLGEAIAERAIAALADPGTAQTIPAGMATAASSVTFTPAGTLLSFAITTPLLAPQLQDYYDLSALGSPARITADLLVVRLGTPEVATTLVTFPGEPLSSTGTTLRADLGGGAQFLFATTNESLGYLVPSAEWLASDEGYEETVSLEQLAGDKAVAAITSALGQFSVLPLADFTDVAAGAYFARGVDWLVDGALTNGFGGPRRFSPGVTLNRSQMALFLWRLMGRPAPVTSPCEFGDMVNRLQEEIDATCWLKEEGVTRGTNAASTRYSPLAPVTREQMGAFMFRLAGGTGESVSCGFTDPPERAEFARAACWLKANGITVGTNPQGTRFSPVWPVTRGQLAAFLYRLVLADEAWGNPRPPLAQTG